MPDKLMSYFFDPNWINQLKDKNEKLAENIGVGAKTITNYKTQKYNPTEDHRNMMTKELGITFDKLRLKDLVLMLTRISDKEITTNCKRVLLLLLLSDGAPGAEIKVKKLKEEGHLYGYGDKEIAAAIKKLASKGIVSHNQNDDKVSLVFEGIKKIFDKYQKAIEDKKNEEKEKKKRKKKK